MPRTTTEGEAGIVSTNLNLVSRPQMDWRFSARFRNYDYSNQTPHFAIAQYVSYDTSVNEANTGGPKLDGAQSHQLRYRCDVDEASAGRAHGRDSRNNTGHDFRIFENTGEDVFRLTASGGLTIGSFGAQDQYGSRTGSGLNETLLTKLASSRRCATTTVANRRIRTNSPANGRLANELWTLERVCGPRRARTISHSYFGLSRRHFKRFHSGLDSRAA